ncbi:MAG TPA: ATP-binding protein [Bryobacteraceae bacterium]|nr:ATP-binding protein [Bryobacteraceae bacterium]
MDVTSEVTSIVGRPENERLEYKAVLPPAVTIARLICSFANTQGGYIILGVSDVTGTVHVNGLSDEFRATSITRKAIDLLSPQPTVHYQYVTHQDKRVFAIRVEKATTTITLAGREYVREGTESRPRYAETTKPSPHPELQAAAATLQSYRSASTAAKAKFLDHYQSVLSIFDDLATLIYPQSVETPTTNPEGKMLTRILFSSCADNFETYLSDLLLEIYLARPETLKSDSTVTVREVLEFRDMQEFISDHARKKVSRLQRGSVEGFIKKNAAINALNVLDATRQAGIEEILQVRHLYSHRNGIVDERFREYFPSAPLHTEHQLSLKDFVQRFTYLAKAVDDVDRAAVTKYQLVLSP